MTSYWIPEDPRVGMRLGRHVEHDERSRNYEYDTTGLSTTPVLHIRHAPVFDQMALGSCVGNASVGSIACDPVFASLPAGHPVLDEPFAVTVYEVATTLDEDPDTYPPTDTGSTGLAGAKALVKLGMIGGYQHTFTFTGMRLAMSQGAVFAGINWYSTFDTPEASGLVRIGNNAYVRGGHEVCADEITTIGNTEVIGFTNSWGPDWGKNGKFYVTFADMERLLSEDGDVTVPVAPAVIPVPVPVPVPPTPSPPAPSPAATPDDVALWAELQRWARAKALIS